MEVEGVGVGAEGREDRERKLLVGVASESESHRLA